MMEGMTDGNQSEKMTTKELARYKDHLTDLKSIQQAAVASLQQTVTEEEKGNMEAKILDLQQELLKQTSFKSAQSLALQRLQMGGHLLQVLFDDDVPVPPQERERIKGLVSQQRELAAEILAHHKHCNELRSHQEKLQTERRELTQLNRSLMTELKTEQQKSNKTENEDLKKMLEEMEETQGYLSIVQNVLQGLIIGSGLNWAQDPKLLELMLSLGSTKL